MTMITTQQPVDKLDTVLVCGDTVLLLYINLTTGEWTVSDEYLEIEGVTIYHLPTEEGEYRPNYEWLGIIVADRCNGEYEDKRPMFIVDVMTAMTANDDF